jgi:hypothetical protein
MKKSHAFSLISDDATPIRTSASMPQMTELTDPPFEYDNNNTNGGL